MVAVDVIVNGGCILLAIIFLVALICGLIWNLLADDYPDVKTFKKLMPETTSCMKPSSSSRLITSANNRAMASWIEFQDLSSKARAVGSHGDRKKSQLSNKPKNQQAVVNLSKGPKQVISEKANGNSTVSVQTGKKEASTLTRRGRKVTFTDDAVRNNVSDSLIMDGSQTPVNSGAKKAGRQKKENNDRTVLRTVNANAINQQTKTNEPVSNETASRQQLADNWVEVQSTSRKSVLQTKRSLKMMKTA